MIQLDANWLWFAMFFGMGLTCGIVSTLLFGTMIHEINRRLAEPERIGPLFGNFSLFVKVLSLHRQFYPDSWLRVVLFAFMGAGVGSTVGLVFAYRLLTESTAI